MYYREKLESLSSSRLLAADGFCSSFCCALAFAEFVLEKIAELLRLGSKPLTLLEVRDNCSDPTTELEPARGGGGGRLAL